MADEKSTLLKDPELVVNSMNDTLVRALHPHAKRIAEIWNSGSVPVVFDSNIERKRRLRLQRGFGAAASQAVVPASRIKLRQILKYPAEFEWLSTQPGDTNAVHVLLFTGLGCLLLVSDADGWHIAPGTLDLELQKQLN